MGALPPSSQGFPAGAWAVILRRVETVGAVACERVEQPMGAHSGIYSTSVERSIEWSDA